MRRLSPTAAAIMFIVYAVLNGFTLSIIFAVYALGTIGLAFFSTAATFAVMTVLGYTTELDLSQYRTYFMMALIGLIIASVVNVFMRSSGLELIISLAGVLIFTVLTAYDTQKIKRWAADPSFTEEWQLAHEGQHHWCIDPVSGFHQSVPVHTAVARSPSLIRFSA